MSKHTIKITIVTSINNSVEFNLHRFIIADNIHKMLNKAINPEENLNRIKHLNVKIEE